MRRSRRGIDGTLRGWVDDIIAQEREVVRAEIAQLREELAQARAQLERKSQSQ